MGEVPTWYLGMNQALDINPILEKICEGKPEAYGLMDSFSIY